MLGVTTLVVSLVGCASSRKVQEPLPMSAVVGTWSYRTIDSPYLSRGVIRLERRRGDEKEVRGRLIDARLGPLRVRGRINNRRLELTIERRLRISGQVMDGTFNARVRRVYYDVTVRSADRQRRGRPSDGGLLRARRTQGGFGPRLPPLDCTQITTEGWWPCDKG
jgi:hypothetical protein